MASIGLSAAKTKLEADIHKALKDAFKSTFIFGASDEGDEIAERFAQTGSSAIADAVYDFISQAQITGTLNGVVTGSCAAGPVAGSSTTPVSPSDLSLI